MAFHATCRDAVHSALHDSVVGITGIRDNCALLAGNRAIDVELRRRGKLVRGRFEVIRLVVLLAVSSKHAHAQPQVQSESLGDMPIVLEIRLHDLVPVVVLGFKIGLIETRDLAGQHVRECVAGADGRIGIVEAQDSLNVGTVLLVLLGRHHIGAEIQVVSANDLGQLVLVGKSRIGVIPGEVAGIEREAAGIVVDASRYTDGRHQSAESVVVQAGHGKVGRAGDRTDGIQEDVIRRIAEGEFVQQSRRYIRREIGHQADSRPYEVGLHGGE